MTTFRIPTKPKGPALPVIQSGYSWDLETDGLTQGLLQRFAACPEKHRLGMVQGYSSVGSRKSTEFGNLFHEVMEFLYQWRIDRQRQNYADPANGIAAEDKLTQYWGEACNRAYKKLRAEGSRYATQEEDLEENVSLSLPVLQGYLRKWWKQDSAYSLVEVERVFDVTGKFADDFGYRKRGKLDRVYRFNGKLWYLDMKTRGEIVESTIADKLRIDLQIAFYLDSMEAVYGEPAIGAVHDIIRRPQLERKKTESLQQFSDRVTEDVGKRPDHYYKRFEVIPSAAMRQRFREELRSRIKLLRMWTAGDFHYRDDSACTGRGYVCEFLPICSRDDYRNVRVREVPFPELEDGKEDEG